MSPRKKKTPVAPKVWSDDDIREANKAHDPTSLGWVKPWLVKEMGDELARAPEPSDAEARDELLHRRLSANQRFARMLEVHRSGRPKGAVKPSTTYINTLAREPGSPKKLFIVAQASGEIGKMTYGTFRNLVGAARKLHAKA